MGESGNTHLDDEDVILYFSLRRIRLVCFSAGPERLFGSARRGTNGKPACDRPCFHAMPQVMPHSEPGRLAASCAQSYSRTRAMRAMRGVLLVREKGLVLFCVGWGAVLERETNSFSS